LGLKGIQGYPQHSFNNLGYFNQPNFPKGLNPVAFSKKRLVPINNILGERGTFRGQNHQGLSPDLGFLPKKNQLGPFPTGKNFNTFAGGVPIPLGPAGLDPLNRGVYKTGGPAG